MNITPQRSDKHLPGFTLVEFIVIMAIFAVMIGVIMFNLTGFRSAVTLDNLAQDIALSIRHVQVIGGASLSESALGGTYEDPERETRRGIAFVDENGDGYDAKFVLFTDLDGNNLPDDTEIFDTVSIQTPDRITAITYGDSITTATTATSAPFGITFGRYKTDAQFSNEVAAAAVARIEITSPDGSKKRYVSINKIGQVSVQYE